MIGDEKMKLERFRVTKFRSVMDSGWIDCDDVTTLVGINEAGKSNLLLALWKLNPAKDGKIDPLHDLPIKLYSAERENLEKIPFISAEFSLEKKLISTIAQKTKCTENEVSIIRVTRYYDGQYDLSFPNFGTTTDIDARPVIDIISVAKTNLSTLNEATKGEAGIKDEAINVLNSAHESVSSLNRLDKSNYEKLKSILVLNTKAASRSEIFPLIGEVASKIKTEFLSLFSNPPQEVDGIKDMVINSIPPFVYYSDYGNLDSQIYLPHAVKWLKGQKVAGFNNEAKVRTLRVLFDFVNLDPSEILELGKDPKLIAIERNGQNTNNYIPTPDEIQKVSDQKSERSILLQSASTDLTQKFKEWWKQGNYVFRFEADGEYFKIWVSDDKRPEAVELERRSTGLQWFLSFYLVFLVESQEAHKNAILLLDEAGLSLHPLAQKDLTAFFDNLSENNQLIHTTHSPFLVDTNSIERVKVVYIDDNGYTIASSNLRAAEDKLNEKSIYAVHAALGLSVSDVLLQGCKPIIVEGVSDQHYFNAIKLFLIKQSKISPSEELIFIPSGGVRGVSGIVSLVSSKEDELPLVILDSDKSGIDTKNKLVGGLYKGQESSLINIGEFTLVEDSEVEDIIPINLMERYLQKMFRDVEEETFTDCYDNQKPLVNQIDSFAAKYNVPLRNGWKVDLARSVKQQLLKAKTETISPEVIECWKKVFDRLIKKTS
jgi:predicted ATP-dependent endonuclease of OLD family